MDGFNYRLFSGSEAYESRLKRLYYEAYPTEFQGGVELIQYMIAIAIKVSQYLVDKDFRGQDHSIKTADEVKSSLQNAVLAVLLSDRTGEKKPTKWLSERVNTLVNLGIFQKLLEPELFEIDN